MSEKLTGSKICKTEPNVVPLCDILLVLLIIFMVVSPLIKNNNSHMKLPEASNAEIQPDSTNLLTVSIKDNGAVFLDLEEVPEVGKLSSMIEDKIQDKKESARSKLLLKADGNIAYGRVAQVMEEIRLAQIEFAGLVTLQKVVNE